MSKNGKRRSTDKLPTPPAVAVAHSDPVNFLDCDENGASSSTKPMVIESAWPLIVNGQHWLTVLCTPDKLDFFVLGFLYNEGLIAGPDEVADLQISQGADRVIRVEMRDRELRLPRRRTLTSGCGGGITFVDLAAAREPVRSSFQVTAGKNSALMGQLMEPVDADHLRIGGFHTSGLSDGHQLRVITTDIGRHNTLDKIAGECLSRGISMTEAVLLTTGRVSIEMLGKAARMQTPVVASFNSPTHLAVELAQEWGITLIGYARGPRMHIYTDWKRILSPENQDS